MAGEGALLHTRCCIVGGGPAGMVLGYLLARAGISVVVLEKHADFLRDFRGDTIHPSTLEIMHELGLLKAFLARPHQKLGQITAFVNDQEVTVADFSHLPTQCKFIVFMPQWDFLNFIADEARKFPGFDLHMESEAKQLIQENGRVCGVRAETAKGSLTVHADLVVASDGRNSDMRREAGLEVIDTGAPIDVLWMRLSHKADDPTATAGRNASGRFFITIDRGDYWQCAYVIPKGYFEEIRAKGLDFFHHQIAQIAPFFQDRMTELDSWDKIKLLTVKVDHLREWAKPGLLCIGDAAHAMSPVGGVGINLAVQDAVATANLLAKPLQSGSPTLDQLHFVQRRRQSPTQMIQRLQVFVQNNVIAPSLGSQKTSPLFVLPRKIVQWFPSLRRIPGRVIGMGFRPEHVAMFLRSEM